MIYSPGKDIGDEYSIINWAKSIWNWVDITTITLLIIVLIYSLLGECYIFQRTCVFSVLTLISWIDFIQFFRFYKKTRIITTYIKASIYAMNPFWPFILIMLIAFSMTFKVYD